jgi:putative heme-binding domain-containing protein
MQLIELCESFKTVGPMESDRLLDTFAQSKDAKVGEVLLAALKVSPIRTSLRTDRLKPIFAKCGTDAKALYAMIDVDAEKQKAKLEEMLPKLKDGDVRRGQAVYLNGKVQCTACHAMGYQGGNIGPELTHIGKIRTERDLVESIMFPSASFVRSYEPVKVTTKAGAVHNGLIRSETTAEITLQLDAERQVRISRDDIDEMVPGKVSIMPAGLDQQLSTQELADLVAFLKSRQ